MLIVLNLINNYLIVKYKQKGQNMQKLNYIYTYIISISHSSPSNHVVQSDAHIQVFSARTSIRATSNILCFTSRCCRTSDAQHCC